PPQGAPKAVRQHAVRRRATDARDRPLPDDAAKTDHPGRADRRHHAAAGLTDSPRNSSYQSKRGFDPAGGTERGDRAQALPARVSYGKGHHRPLRCLARTQGAARDRASISRAVSLNFAHRGRTSMARKLSRRSFLEVALAGGALGTANLTLMRDVYAQASGPIVIGHHCDLTGVISSWGYWHDKCAKAAVDIINKGGGIAGRKVQLATEDTESNPASGARKLRNLIQRGNAEFIVGSVHSGVMLAALPIASELKTPYFSAGEATEVTGAKGTRYSFRTGTDTYSIAATSMPWCVENLGKAWTIIYADYAWGQSTNQESKLYIEKAGGRVLASIPVPLDTKDFVPYVAQIPKESTVVLPAFIGSLSVAFYTQAKAMGLDKQMKMFSSSASLESIDPGDIQGAAEGVYFFENFPRMLAHKNDEYHKEFNRLIAIDDVYCREIGGSRVMDKSHGWQAW